MIKYDKVRLENGHRMQKPSYNGTFLAPFGPFLASSGSRGCKPSAPAGQASSPLQLDLPGKQLD